MINKICLILSLACALRPPPARAGESAEFADKVAAEHGLSGAQADRLRAVLTRGPLTRNIGTEDPRALVGPNNSFHPASREQCARKVLATGAIRPNASFERKCGAKWMAPVPDYPGQPLEQARVCIDQFEFPDIPCEFPVAWTTGPTARQICESMGKRICDSGEWEGGCAGSMAPESEYYFGQGQEGSRASHNRNRQITWAAGLQGGSETRANCGVYTPGDPEIDPSVRGRYAPAGQSRGCNPGVSPTLTCGTNTWPSGFKANCRSAAGVYDMHGNLAEAVNLPMAQGQQGKFGRGPLGMEEHKGSFFVHRPQYPDDCRVRQPFEHATSFMANGMAFYQEGFRCCKDVR